MDKKILSRIFDPFFTTKGPGEGTGLGLSVVHGIVRSHDGLLTVSSTPGTGTEFTIYFPIVQSAAEIEKPAKPSLPRGKGERLLVVDDEPALRSSAKQVLEHLGYQVTLAENPQSALEAFRSDPAQFAAVITDLTMPGMTGIVLAGEILRLRQHVPILLVTGFGGELTIEQVRSMGIHSMILKPLTLQSLANAVQALLQR